MEHVSALQSEDIKVRHLKISRLLSLLDIHIYNTIAYASMSLLARVESCWPRDAVKSGKKSYKSKSIIKHFFAFYLLYSKCKKIVLCHHENYENSQSLCRQCTSFYERRYKITYKLKFGSAHKTEKVQICVVQVSKRLPIKKDIFNLVVETIPCSVVRISIVFPVFLLCGHELAWSENKIYRESLLAAATK